MPQLSRVAQRVADSLAADVLNGTRRRGADRADVLDRVAAILRDRAHQLREERIARPSEFERVR